ncbi:MAG: hypothetical protein IJO46_14155, partial [Thermoguttaceae bacterium]|nr:hypothetical protein [Thermoguttaceae bacterium]
KSAKILEIAPRFRYTVVCRFGVDVFRVRNAEISRTPRRFADRFAGFVININTRFFFAESSLVFPANPALARDAFPSPTPFFALKINRCS